jgi:hypothetical protein
MQKKINEVLENSERINAPLVRSVRKCSLLKIRSEFLRQVAQNRDRFPNADRCLARLFNCSVHSLVHRYIPIVYYRPRQEVHTTRVEPMKNECVLMGREILEFASLWQRAHSMRMFASAECGRLLRHAAFLLTRANVGTSASLVRPPSTPPAT